MKKIKAVFAIYRCTEFHLVTKEEHLSYDSATMSKFNIITNMTFSRITEVMLDVANALKAMYDKNNQ